MSNSNHFPSGILIISRSSWLLSSKHTETFLMFAMTSQNEPLIIIGIADSSIDHFSYDSLWLAKQDCKRGHYSSHSTQSYCAYDPTRLGGFVLHGWVGYFCLTQPDRVHDEGGGAGIRKETRQAKLCISIAINLYPCSCNGHSSIKQEQYVLSIEHLTNNNKNLS